MIFDFGTMINKKKPYAFLLWHLFLRNPLLVGWLFKAIWYSFLYKVKILNSKDYQIKRWKFIDKIDLDNPKVRNFFKKIHFNPLIELNQTKLLLVDYAPKELVQIIIDKRNIDFINLVENEIEKLDYDKYDSILISPANYSNLFRKNPKVRIFFNGKIYDTYFKFLLFDWLSWFRDIIILGIMAIFLESFVIFISGYKFNIGMVFDEFMNPKLVFFNTFPIFILLLILYAILNSLSWSIILGSVPFLVIGIVNFFMLKYRSFPFKFADIFLSSEAANMGTRYSYIPPKIFILGVIGIVVLAFVLGWIFKSSRYSMLRSLILLIPSIGLFLIFNQQYYQNVSYYKNIVPITRGNMWNETNRYVTNGSVYSFINSISQNKLVAPKGYTEEKAKNTLAKYKYQNIPKSKKINFITIQLEAYNDFSKFGTFDIDPSVYAGLKEIQKESLHGDLTTNIFGGGTVDTERKVLTGYSKMQDLVQNTNSFTRYFNDQGYQTLKLHPGYGWFYNRQNIEKYFGFDNFLYKENYYNAKVSNEGVVTDSLVFDNLHKQYKKVISKGNKLFNQTVTYQNHGPYATDFEGESLVKWRDRYNKDDYAIINNYLTGIKKTNEALVKLIDNFKKEKEPVVIAFWGDHNPWGGAGNSTYSMLGIDLDQSTTKGFKNFFDTPYVMWANDAAQKLMDKPLIGNGPDISPMYVLPTIFNHLDIKGSSYMQYLQEMQKTIPVIGLNRFMYKNQLVGELPTDVKQQYDEFLNVQYYLQTTMPKKKGN